jgi:hypothetical protein
MVGPQMLREFAAPYVRNELRRFEGATYHLDGPGARQHLDARTRTEVVDCLAALEAATAEKPEPPAIRRRDRQHR